MSRLLAYANLFALAACASIPPAAPVAHSAMSVTASFGKTWDSVIDVFADQNIAIKTLDRSSGLIVAEPQHVTRDAALEYADCGTVLGVKIPAGTANWNVLVRGDSTRATVRANVRFVSETQECTSRWIWETDLERRIKAKAEAR